MPSILVATDNSQLRRLLIGALLGRCRLRTVDNVRQALTLLEQASVDAILLELDMREGDGYALLSHASCRHPKPCIVALCLPDHVDTAVQAIKLGADDCIATPCDTETAAWAVQDVLSQISDSRVLV